MARYLVKTGNIETGGDGNLAVTTFHCDNLSVSDEQIAAQLVAFMVYCSPAGGTYVRAVEVGGDAPGPTLPIAWPAAEWAPLEAGDVNLPSLTAYSQDIGDGPLATVGVGIVLTKRTTTPGRHGRGRLTTPWLNKGAVTDQGQATQVAQDFAVEGWNEYVAGDAAAASLLIPYIWPLGVGAGNIAVVTTTSRLGRVRSRTQ